MESVLPAVTERGVRVIANAGGVNPGACADAVQEMARGKGASLRIGVVTGDDLLPEPYTSTSTEAIALSSVKSVVVTRMVTNPDRGAQPAAEAVLTIGWGGVGGFSCGGVLDGGSRLLGGVKGGGVCCAPLEASRASIRRRRCCGGPPARTSARRPR